VLYFVFVAYYTQKGIIMRVREFKRISNRLIKIFGFVNLSSKRRKILDKWIL